MQNQNWQKVLTVATVTVLIVSFTTLAVAQRVSSEDRRAIFASSSRVQTSVNGVTAIAGAPKGFDPLTATNRELLSYGLPQRPDKTVDAKAYQIWERAMLAVKPAAGVAAGTGHTSSNPMTATDVKAKPFTSREMMPAKSAAKSNLDGTVSYDSLNWSGIANFNSLAKWNAKTSFDEVVSVWNVPVSDHPFGDLPCSEGPWYEVSWNGIDGAFNGDVVQGGSLIYWDGGGCGGSISYEGWVEWYPSYSILTIYCGSSPCPVSPGDDFYTVTYGAPGTDEQFVFVEDITQQWSGTFGLPYIQGPGLVGRSAEYIVERPCCDSAGYPLALNNYIYEFFDYSFAYDGAGTLFYPGNAGAKTAIFNMLDDPEDQVISEPYWYGTAGNQGRYSIWFSDEGCAYSGGCTKN
jgi:hypothetical protein